MNNKVSMEEQEKRIKLKKLNQQLEELGPAEIKSSYIVKTAFNGGLLLVSIVLLFVALGLYLSNNQTYLTLFIVGVFFFFIALIGGIYNGLQIKAITKRNRKRRDLKKEIEELKAL